MYKIIFFIFNFDQISYLVQYNKSKNLSHLSFENLTNAPSLIQPTTSKCSSLHLLFSPAYEMKVHRPFSRAHGIAEYIIATDGILNRKTILHYIRAIRALLQVYIIHSTMLKSAGKFPIV